MYFPFDCLGLIKGSIHDRNFSSSIFRFAYFKDTVPVPAIFFFFELSFYSQVSFLVSPILSPPNHLKQNKKISINEKDLLPKRISEADLGLTASASKMELFLTIVDVWTALNIVTKSSIFDAAAAQNLPLNA